MTKVLFDSENYYEGYSETEDAYVVGSYEDLYDSEDIQNDTIQSSDLYEIYEEDAGFFKELIQEYILAYEKQYRTTVSNIALAGYVGLWNGNRIGGNIFDKNKNPIYLMGDVEQIKVEVDDDNIITIKGYHHDGVHRMNLYLLTENKLKKVAPQFLHHDYVDADEIENIFNELKPLKYGSLGSRYYGQLSA